MKDPVESLLRVWNGPADQRTREWRDAMRCRTDLREDWPALASALDVLSATYTPPVPAGGTDFLSVSEAAEKLKISKQTVYREVAKGRIQSIRFGNSIRIPAATLQHIHH